MVLGLQARIGVRRDSGTVEGSAAIGFIKSHGQAPRPVPHALRLGVLTILKDRGARGGHVIGRDTHVPDVIAAGADASHHVFEVLRPAHEPAGPTTDEQRLERVERQNDRHVFAGDEPELEVNDVPLDWSCFHGHGLLVCCVYCFGFRAAQRFIAAARACSAVRALALPRPALPPSLPRALACGFLLT